MYNFKIDTASLRVDDGVLRKLEVVNDYAPWIFSPGESPFVVLNGDAPRCHITSPRAPFTLIGERRPSKIDRRTAQWILEKDREEGDPVLSLSFENNKTTCFYNINLDPANPAPPAAEWLAKSLDEGRLRCPWCGDLVRVDLASLGDGPSAYPPRPMIYARLVHVGCPVVTETGKINAP